MTFRARSAASGRNPTLISLCNSTLLKLNLISVEPEALNRVKVFVLVEGGVQELGVGLAMTGGLFCSDVAKLDVDSPIRLVSSSSSQLTDEGSGAHHLAISHHGCRVFRHEPHELICLIVLNHKRIS